MITLLLSMTFTLVGPSNSIPSLNNQVSAQELGFQTEISLIIERIRQSSIGAETLANIEISKTLEIDELSQGETLEMKVVTAIVKAALLNDEEAFSKGIWASYHTYLPVIKVALNICRELRIPERFMHRDFLFAWVKNELDPNDPFIQQYVDHAHYGPFPKIVRIFPERELFPITAARRAGDWDLALELVNVYLETYQDLQKINAGLGEKGLIYQLRDELSKALEVQEMGVKCCDPNNPLRLSSHYYEMSRTLSKMGHQDKAIETILKAIQLTEQSEFPYYDKIQRIQMMRTRLGLFTCLDHRVVEGRKIINEVIEVLSSRILTLDEPEVKRLMQIEIDVAFEILSQFPII